MKDYYRILKVPKNAGQETIRQQYRLLMSECHPDKFTNPEEKDRAGEQVKEINEAYEILSDPAKRAAYDRSVRQPGAGVSKKTEGGTTERPPVGWVQESYLHKMFFGGGGDRVWVEIDRPANVLLLDPANYERYHRGESFRYRGGFARSSPVQLQIPHTGNWHVIVDDGGSGFGVSADVRVIHHRHFSFF
jgi:curved DNA-binding protein CbpA